MQAIDRRHLLGDRSLARGCRSVYSDDHRHLGYLGPRDLGAGRQPADTSIARRRIKGRREKFRKGKMAS
jgi:hypothetical protein